MDNLAVSKIIQDGGGRPLNGFAIETDELDRVVSLASKVLDIRITFFDADLRELRHFHIKPMSGFCSALRRSKEMNARCEMCDREHIHAARETGRTAVYRCHAGLYEAVVPLHDTHRQFLGAIVFGQLRAVRGRPPKGLSAGLRRRWERLGECDEARMHDIADMLKYTAEYIIHNELVRRRNPNWVDAIDRYIEEHLRERITLADLARVVHRSRSFVSHTFSKEFGSSPMKYVADRKLDAAREMLKGGATVVETAMALSYYDEFHFSKAFRKRFGAPPSAFKESAD
jgi:AraC-like DNA-binding protein